MLRRPLREVLTLSLIVPAVLFFLFGLRWEFQGWQHVVIPAGCYLVVVGCIAIMQQWPNFRLPVFVYASLLILAVGFAVVLAWIQEGPEQAGWVALFLGIFLVIGLVALFHNRQRTRITAKSTPAAGETRSH